MNMFPMHIDDEATAAVNLCFNLPTYLPDMDLRYVVL